MSEIVFEEANLVKTKKGTLPILLTCPHDGKMAARPSSRKNGYELTCEMCQFRVENDLDCNTFEITKGVAERIFALSNEWPYVVIFNAHRKYIDVNREKKCGCEVLEAEIYYDAYHSAIDQFVQEIRTTNKCGNGLVFLFDIHGKNNNTEYLSVSTRNKGTIQSMVNFNPGWGWDYKFGLISLLIKKNYTIMPGSPCQEDDPTYFGGYTVIEHGGWQFEIPRSKRDPGPERDSLINNLAEIIHKFYGHNCIQGSHTP